jgi:hypothetical protein
VSGLVLSLCVARAFYISPVHYLADAKFSLLMDEALIHKWTPNIIDYQVPRGRGGIFINDGYPYNIKIIKGRLLYVYSWGSSLLSLPAVLLFNAAGLKIAPYRSPNKYNLSNELRMQTIITTGLCAIAIWLIYDAAGYLLPFPWSLAIALGAAFGTPIWSSASRSLWPQTWAVLLTAAAIWIFLSGSVKPVLLGTLLAWSCLARPQVIPDVAIITGYTLLHYGRRFLWRYVAAGLCWTIPVCGVMLFFTGGAFSVSYNPGMLDFPQEFWRRLYGLLFSPSRGLFVFSPLTLVPLYLTIRYWKILPDRRLATLALVIIGMHLVMVSSWVVWWGGASYGPRLLLEVVPWFVLLAILGFSAFVEDHSLAFCQRSITISITALALAVSIGTNAPGALVRNSIDWRPLDPDHLQVLWDWHDPQFLCWVQRLQN